jgi:hypothetical protein|tara:strand:+ start:366 stop:1409 length:1044 start_codon:yes stop_codon:yes gene_type:complete
MLKIVSLGTSNAISAIAFAIKQWGKGHNISLYRIFKKPGKALSEEDVDNLKNCDAYLVNGTWGSTSPQRQKYKTVDIEKDKDGKIIDFKRFAWMEYINLQANLLSKKYNKPLLVTESATLSRIKCNYIDTWYKKTGPRYYRMGKNQWTYGKTKWCKPLNFQRLNNMIMLTERYNSEVKLENIYNHQWKNNKDGAVLIVPGLEHDPTSSMPVPEFIKTTVEKVRKATTRKILVKAHPHSKIVIEDLVEDVEVVDRDISLNSIIDKVYCGVLGESTSIFQLINLGIPCITSKYNFGVELENTNIDKIEDLYYAKPEEVLEWYKMVSYTEFTLQEFDSDKIFPYIKELIQ